MARKKRRTGVGGPRAVPEDPDFNRDEAAQPDLTEAERKRKAAGEASAARLSPSGEGVKDRKLFAVLGGGGVKVTRWLRPVYSKAKRSQVRGLMCLTSINNITRFYDRDVSAALNIRRCAVGPGPRPTELCYWTNRPTMPKPGQPGQDWVEIPDKPLLRKWQRQLQQ
ncbi:hypothetical protein QJQ45_003380 [Haematococcus lacustris]|nr:hypothetical protein QJQ45_003380 [Haematococcus lacustris]